MDVFDQTDVVESKLLDLRIQAARSAEREIEPIGECHNCGEPFTEADTHKLFCDSECSTDWERLKRAGRGR